MIDKEQKKDENFQKIICLWVANIDKAVIKKQLIGCLNQLVDLGYNSEYLLFVVSYIIKHRNEYNLNYPYGLRYFVGNKDIKNAYTKSKIKINKSVFEITDDETKQTKFAAPKSDNGFQIILKSGGDNN